MLLNTLLMNLKPSLLLIISAIVMTGTLFSVSKTFAQSDSLMITSVPDSAAEYQTQKLLQEKDLLIMQMRDSLNAVKHSLHLNEEKIKQLSADLEEKNTNLQEQLRIQREKELLFLDKERLYKEAVNSTILDKVKLEGQISARDSRLEGKEREIILLQQNLDDKNRDIVSRTNEMQRIMNDREQASRFIDTLQNKLLEKEKSLIKTSEQLKYTELKVKDCESRYTSVTNKKKKTRVVQGFAIKGYRTPDYVLSPKDVNNPSVYVINNRNSSDVEFDFVTGATFMIKDLSKPEGTLTYDVGFFLGFGGNNLFKNFYIGPNIKLFDVVHINAGANIAEYEVLKSGFEEGQALPLGIAIPTNKSWKINGYVGLTFDLELITLIGKK